MARVAVGVKPGSKRPGIALRGDGVELVEVTSDAPDFERLKTVSVRAAHKAEGL